MTLSAPLATRARLSVKSDSVATLRPVIETGSLSPTGPDEVLVEIRAAAVNTSDVKAAIGMMPYAVFPRTPGRDFAGVVLDGPADLIGARVFGSSGDLGIRRDGTHGSHVLVPRDGVIVMPDGLSFAQAAGIGVPFVTAMEGFRRAGMPVPGETVLIAGINGKVGQAAAQIATWRGARVIGVARSQATYMGHASAEVPVLRGPLSDVAQSLREMTDGHGADIVFNTVGDPFFDLAHRSLAKDGRQILIAAISPVVSFNIFEFYRGRHSYFGIDTLSLTCGETASRLRGLLDGFSSGALRPFDVSAESIYPLHRIADAYREVMGATSKRIILSPGDHECM